MTLAYPVSLRLRRRIALRAVAAIACIALAAGADLRAQAAVATTATTPPPAAPPPPPTGPYGLAWGSEVASDLIAAGQPTADQLGALAGAGFRGVLDLRTEGEARDFDEPARAAELGLTYTRLPITGATLDAAALDAFTAALAAAPRPLLLHCGTSNRVGAMLYGSWVMAGMEPQAALAKAREAGLKSPELQAAIEKILGERGQLVQPPSASPAEPAGEPSPAPPPAPPKR